MTELKKNILKLYDNVVDDADYIIIEIDNVFYSIPKKDIIKNPKSKINCGYKHLFKIIINNIDNDKILIMINNYLYNKNMSIEYILTKDNIYDFFNFNFKDFLEIINKNTSSYNSNTKYHLYYYPDNEINEINDTDFIFNYLKEKIINQIDYINNDIIDDLIDLINRIYY